jgi:hypothetical protein
MYTVSDVAKMLDVSRVTIYRKIETAELQQHVTIKNKVKYIDNKGIDLLKEKLGCNVVQQENSNIGVTDQLHELQMLQLETEHLKRELEAKDKHIETLTNETVMLQGMLQHEQESGKDLRKLIENSQILLKQSQDKIFFLESAEKQKDTPKPWWRVWK